jgi:hypothetical protein
MAAPVGPEKVHRCSLEFKIQAVKLANHARTDEGYRQRRYCAPLSPADQRSPDGKRWT